MINDKHYRIRLFEDFEQKNVQTESDYKKWKRANVTIRGMQEVGEENGAGAMLGQGLYTAFLSNRDLAKQYGKVSFVLNAKPKKPLKFNYLNDWEVWFQRNLLKPYNYRLRDFHKNTTIEKELLKMGYDGIEITGREMVNFTPSENVMFFSNENQLRAYYFR